MQYIFVPNPLDPPINTEIDLFNFSCELDPMKLGEIDSDANLYKYRLQDKIYHLKKQLNDKDHKDLIDRLDSIEKYLLHLRGVSNNRFDTGVNKTDQDIYITKLFLIADLKMTRWISKELLPDIEKEIEELNK